MRKLRTEQEIAASWKGDINKPVVSVCCIAFNQELYIEDAIEGFLIQETDFPFEVIINDDASNDKTADIIQKYAVAYPSIVKPILQSENQFSVNPHLPFGNTCRKARGEYIAICEGDDYWTSVEKLQAQKNFMDQNLDFSFCFHKVEEIDETNMYSAYSAYTPLNKSVVLAKDVILNHFIPTLSLFYRRKLLVKYLDKFNKSFVSGDIFIEVILATQGKGYFFKDFMGVRRHHDGGITKYLYGRSNPLRSLDSNLSLYKTLIEISPLKYSRYLSLRSTMKCDYHLFRYYLRKKEYRLSLKKMIDMSIKEPFLFLYILKRKVKNGYL